jgi:hypothetical protein
VTTDDPIICPTCLLDISVITGCDPNHAYVYGLEPNYRGRIPETCDDCNAHIGRPHHVPGCTNAICRHCEDQATFCEHIFELER